METTSASSGELLLVLAAVATVVPVWVFSLLDIFRRRDLTDCWKTWWSAVVIVFPILGALAYLVYLNVRPPRRMPEDDRVVNLLSDLRERGVLTDDEFAAEKERLTAPFA
jgi:hypothetical protein